MVQQRSGGLPTWLTFLLIIAVVVTSVAVGGFAFLTAEAYLSQPFNPLDGGLAQANNGADGTVDGNGNPNPAIVPVESADGGIGEPLATADPQVVIDVTQTAAASEALLARSERITILLMGIDRRPGEAFVSRTDSMMIVSINPDLQTASLMSVPRDLYAEIPGYGRDRVNTAFVRGAANGGPVGGAQLSMQTVAYNLGIPIDHYVLIDFNAFTQAIDALGGIDVNVPETINDPTYPNMNYGFDPLFIPAGMQHFDGATALKYARTRHGSTDFSRSQRQQQVMLAARDRVLAMGADELLFQLPFLYQQLEDGIRTDLSLSQIIALSSAASTLPQENIKTAVLDYRYFSDYTTPSGASVLILQNQRVAPVIQELFFD